MNLICNNCCGSRIYNVKGVQFNNPFQWNVIFREDFIKLVNTYRDIDLSGVKLKYGHYKFIPKSKCVVGTLPGGIKIWFIHYLYGGDDNLETIINDDGSNIVSTKILDYATSKWKQRSLRRPSEPVTFLYSFNYCTEGKTSAEYQKTLDMLIRGCHPKGNDRLVILVHPGKHPLPRIPIPHNIRVVEVPNSIMATTHPNGIKKLGRELVTPMLPYIYPNENDK